MKRGDATGVCAKQVAYLAGPMRGYAEYNFPAFHAAAAKLRGHGLDVWSPAEHDVNEDGFDPAKDTHQPMKHYMRRDLPAVLDADMVCVLPGWEKSQGACLEVLVAQTCGIPVYVAETMQPIPSKPSETATTMGGHPDRGATSLSVPPSRLSSAELEVLGWRVMHGDGMTRADREAASKVILEAAADARGEPRTTEANAVRNALTMAGDTCLLYYPKDHPNHKFGRLFASLVYASGQERGASDPVAEASAPSAIAPTEPMVTMPRKLLEDLLNVAEETEARWPNDRQFYIPCEDARDILKDKP